MKLSVSGTTCTYVLIYDVKIFIWHFYLTLLYKLEVWKHICPFVLFHCYLIIKLNTRVLAKEIIANKESKTKSICTKQKRGKHLFYDQRHSQIHNTYALLHNQSITLPSSLRKGMLSGNII